MNGFYIFCGIILCHVTFVSSQTIADAKNLQTRLFDTNQYNKKIRPSTDQSAPITVYLNFYLLAINGLDEVSEVLKTTGYLWIKWNDGLLQWTPKNYGGLEDYFWPQDDVWKPDITLLNSNKEYKELGVSSLNVRVGSDGWINWYPYQVFESTCSMSIEYFPFDVQTCSLEFVAWSYTSTEISLEGGADGINLDRYSPNSAWEIIGSNWDVQQNSGEVAISFNIKMKRKPLYFILSVILPITLLAVLNMFVFILPVESGERSGYAVTVFLALAVFLTIVSETLPANSDKVAIFSVYLIIQTLQSTVITLIALVMLRIYSLGEDTNIPSCLVAILRFLHRIRSKRGNKIGNKNEKHRECELEEHISVVDVNDSEHETNHGGSMVTQRNEDPKFTWKDVITFLDTGFLFFFTAVFVISSAVCFGIATTAEPENG